MFEVCLTGAELAFRRDKEAVFQIQLSPSRKSLPLTRSYVLDASTGHSRAQALTRSIEQIT